MPTIGIIDYIVGMKKDSKKFNKKASPHSGGASSFALVDRNGKAHVIGKKSFQEEERAPLKSRENKEEDFKKKSFNSFRGGKEGGFKSEGRKPFGGDRPPRRDREESRGNDRPPRNRPKKTFGGERPRFEKSFEDRPKKKFPYDNDRPVKSNFGGERDRPRGNSGSDRDRPRKSFGSDRERPRGGFGGDRDRSFGGDRNRDRGFSSRGREERSFGRDRPRRESREFTDSSEREFGIKKSPHAGTPLRLVATLQKNPKGFGFLVFDQRDYEDAFLSPNVASQYFHGDRLEVFISAEYGDVIDVKLLEHRYTEVVGKYIPRGNKDYLYFERKKVKEEILLKGLKQKIPTGHWVRAKLVFKNELSEEAQLEVMESVYAEVIETYGETIPATADVSMIAAEFGLIEEHTKAAVSEAESYVLDLHDPHRMDLTEVPFITIDGETARDFDDAVYVEKLNAGYRLWVAIADVSHYVKKGTALDDEAYGRATSVYFPERAFHMLPRALSENLCSLRPHEKRLTMVCRMDFSFEGRITATRVMNAIIESKRRATYNEIQAEFDANGTSPDFPYAAHFELYRILRKKRHAGGSIDFDLPEAELKVDEKGEPVSIIIRPRLDAHRLIEQFMISANEAVTEWALEKHSPFIYRVHEDPAEKTLMKFEELCHHSGVDIQMDYENLTESLQKVIKLIENHPAQHLLNSALLRSMKQAHYTSVHGGHFGLASRAYTHFTSPIRRYPDLLVHRMLKRIIEEERLNKNLSSEEKDKLNSDLQDAAEHCSYKERTASEAERESIKLKQARYILKELGNEFTGKITGLMERGFFVTLDNPYVEGMVSVDTIDDDQYEFKEERMFFQGRRKRRTYQIGQKIEVVVARVDLETRQIDFTLTEDQSIPVSKVHPHEVELKNKMKNNERKPKMEDNGFNKKRKTAGPRGKKRGSFSRDR